MSNVTAAPVPLTPAELGIHLDNSLGAAFIGLIVAAILYGVTNVQTLIYYQSSGRDPAYMRIIIAFLWCLDSLHLALICHVLYFYLITNFTNLAIITKPTWSLDLHVIVTTLSDFIVRLYYTRRVWILTKKNWFLTIVAGTFSFITFVSGNGFAIKIFSYDSTTQFAHVSWDLYLSLGSGVAADVWVATTLCWTLAKNRTGFRGTDTTINVLMAYIVNTGLLTSFSAICTFVTYATMPNNYIFIGFYFSLSKLYFNSLLATLNAREFIRDGKSTRSIGTFGSGSGNGATGGSYPMPRIVTIGGSSASETRKSLGSSPPHSPARANFDYVEKSSRPLAVTVETETSFKCDADSTESFSVDGRLKSILPI